jgi:hypothetical protein
MIPSRSPLPGQVLDLVNRVTPCGAEPGADRLVEPLERLADLHTVAALGSQLMDARSEAILRRQMSRGAARVSQALRVARALTRGRPVCAAVYHYDGALHQATQWRRMRDEIPRHPRSAFTVPRALCRGRRADEPRAALS